MSAKIRKYNHTNDFHHDPYNNGVCVHCGYCIFDVDCIEEQHQDDDRGGCLTCQKRVNDER